MVGYDPARFDYLFEPIDEDAESAASGGGEVLVRAPSRIAPKRPSSWLAIAAAIIIGAGVASVALWPTPVDAVQSPAGGAATTAPPKPVPSTPDVVLPPMPSATPEPAPAPEPTADVVPFPVSVPRSPEPEPEPDPEPVPAARPPSPTVRSPMSVSPAPRPAFPNQQVPDGDGNRNRGGLLGRGGLL